MATPAPETSWGMLAGDSNVSELLVVVALCEVVLRFLCFDVFTDVAEVSKGKDSP